MRHPHSITVAMRIPARRNGFSLIELMIVMVIVLVMSIAIFGILSTSEGQKRTMTTTNDANQAGNYAMYQLDKAIRQAGSGYGYGWQTALGCELFAGLNNSNGASGTILPFPSTMAAPFTSLNTTLGGIFRLAPIVIASGATTGTTAAGATAQASDALIIMSGTAGYGEFPDVLTAATATTVTLTNTVSFKESSLALLVNDTVTSPANAPSPCMITEVNPAYTTAASVLPLGGAYNVNPITTTASTGSTTGATSASMNLTGLPISAVSAAFNIGNADPAVNNLPSFQIIGVGNNNVLYSYDLLQGGTSGAAFNTPLQIADSVFELHALYYLTTGAWASASAAPYDVATLENGSSASNLTLSTIKAIRLGIIMRSALPQKTAVTPGPLVLFSDTGLSVFRTLAAAEQNYRYRTIEATIPLRNSLFLTGE